MSRHQSPSPTQLYVIVLENSLQILTYVAHKIYLRKFTSFCLLDSLAFKREATLNLIYLLSLFINSRLKEDVVKLTYIKRILNGIGVDLSFLDSLLRSNDIVIDMNPSSKTLN